MFSRINIDNILLMSIQDFYINTTLKRPQSFTGKERDSETGFSYFGARFYDSDLMTGWLSVDPLADKYPGLSPYAYCAWNPVKLVDPDGRDVEIVKNDENKTVTIRANFYYNKKEMGDYGDAFVNGFKNSLNLWENDIKLALNDYNVEFDFNMIETNSPKADATNDAIGNAITRDESLNGTETTSRVTNNKYLDVYPDKHSKAKYTDLKYQDNLYYSYEGCEGTIKHEIGHLFGLYDRYVDNNGKQPGGTPINGDIMNLPGKRKPNSGVGVFLRIWNSMGLNQPGNKTVIINQDNKEKL